ncbi:unnamed protein product [Spirodela intermedia]|uniref:F-box domain-containing protein n=1 Tax=Spirodela intermedia TaxID=51605 RepID=A0A7I8JNI2_SPIIN|nr:unnamed protein product [Spirodela intermedia]CAA6671724.1 unnamed protein product [Spirodela intermedia]
METWEKKESATTVGLCLLPSELLHEIFSRLALPDLLRLRAASKVLAGEFRGACVGLGGTWLFLFKKRPPRDAVLRGFNDRAGRWFRFRVATILRAAAPPGDDDLYFLAADGDFFLFASNERRELIAANLRTGAARRLPASPLGPRGTSSWRRPGLKLLAGPSGTEHFRFLFAEVTQQGPVLFEYSSEAGAWRSSPAEQTAAPPPPGAALLNAAPEIVRWSSARAARGERCSSARGSPRPATGCASTATGTSPWSALGDELRRGRWEMVAGAPPELIEMAGRPYCVMTGCLEEAGGVVTLVLMSNYKGMWDLTWVTFDKKMGRWGSVPVPDYGAKGLNMAGIAITSSLGLRPAAPPPETTA